MTEGLVSLNIKAVFDCNINELILQPPTQGRQAAGIWDTGEWDVDFWDFVPKGSAVPLGAAGMGRTMGIGWRGSSEKRITFTGWDVMFKTGGLL